MILQELVRYYDRKAKLEDPAERLPTQGLEAKEIAFLIEVAIDGSVTQLIDTQQWTGKKRRARSFLVPQGVKKTSGVAANLLWDSAAYVIGLDRARKGTAELTPAAAFLARIESLAESAQADDGIQAVLAALRRADWSVVRAHPAWPDIEQGNPLMTFRLVGDLDLVCQRPAVMAAAAAADAAAKGEKLARCLVDGIDAPVQRLHTSIKGVWGAQSSGANIVSFNARAFESYGKTERQGENAPVGERAAFAYTTALNHLLGKYSRNRVQVGDASTVFWADGESAFDGEYSLADFFGERKDDPDRGVRAVGALYAALRSGQLPLKERGVTFYVLGLAPNAARISVRFWLTAPLSELAPRILAHFDDVKVVRRYDSEPPPPSLFRLLSGLALLGKLDNVPPNLAGDWMRAILEGRAYPATLLNAAVTRCKAEQDVTYLRAAVIKACLNRARRVSQTDRRRNEQHFKERLDMQQDDNPYLLGRLFAVLERVQEESARPAKLNSTIRDRYFGAASTTPALVFPTLLRLKNAHLKKLHRPTATGYEIRIGEISGTVTQPRLMAFPRQLTLHQQGSFALGYYHQRQEFYIRKEDVDSQPDSTDEENPQ